jgi:serine protease AprX
MRPIIALVAAAAILLTSVSTTAAIVNRDLKTALYAADDGQLIRICIKPANGPDLAAISAEASLLPREARRAFVVAALKSAAAENHASVISLLQEEAALGNARDMRSLWLSNVVGAQATKSTIHRLSQMPSVASLELVTYENALISHPDRESPAESANPTPLMPDTVWNLGLVDAPCAWELGYTGQGIVVGHFDTGVNYNHVDLADHVWVNSAETPNNSIDDDSNGYIDDYYGYDFYNADPDPADDNGHGTHTAGTVAGDGTAGRNTGVAPDARIMSLKVLSASGGGSEFDTWEAMQYAIEMGADVLTFSIGWLYFYDPDRATWRGTFDGVRLAGVCAAVAAGNEGQHWLWPWWFAPPENLRTPGDVPPPWLHPNQTLTGGLGGVVSVGATDASDVLASFSSIGPVSWDSVLPYMDYPYDPEMGLLDPAVSAPGVEITSLRHSSNTGYVGGFSWSGTSMACPHVAGLMALMLSKHPSLTPAEVDSIIEMTALPLGAPGKDNQYGSGRIRVCEAIAAVGVQEDKVQIPLSGLLSLLARPNPFRERLDISVFCGSEGLHSLSISVYDATGRLVKNLALSSVRHEQAPLSLTWDGRDSNGMPLTAGIYFLQARTDQGVLTEKLVVLD